MSDGGTWLEGRRRARRYVQSVIASEVSLTKQRHHSLFMQMPSHSRILPLKFVLLVHEMKVLDLMALL